MPRRRGVGVGAVKRREKTARAFTDVGAQMQETQLAHVREQLGSFRANLEEFARKHKTKINRDPHFRAQFQRMCARIGVDPLASNKGFWAELLGVGDYYFELGVQIVDVALSTRAENGGLMNVDDLHARLQRKRPQDSVSLDDVRRAIGKLAVLGGGFVLLRVGAQDMVVSVPRELSADHSAVLEVAQRSGGLVDVSALASGGWAPGRIQQAVDMLVAEGMAWVDSPEGGSGGQQYWVPSLWRSSS